MSGVPPPMIQPSPYLAARSNATSAVPPISSPGRPCGSSGPTPPAVPNESPSQTRFQVASISSKSRPRVWKSTPEAS